MSFPQLLKLSISSLTATNTLYPTYQEKDLQGILPGLLQRGSEFVGLCICFLPQIHSLWACVLLKKFPLQ